MHDEQRSKEELIEELKTLRQLNSELQASNTQLKYKAYVAIVDKETEKRAADKLKESQELLKALIDFNPSLVFLKDEEGKYVYLNKTYEQQFARSNDWYGKSDYEFWPKESADLFRANDKEVMESGKIHQYLEDSIDLDGNRYCWLCYKFPFIDSKNRKYLGGIGIDATQQVIVKEALRESETKYRALFENSQAAMHLLRLLLDEHGEVVDLIYVDGNQIDRLILETLGDKTFNEVVGRRYSELLPSAFVANIIDLMKRLKAASGTLTEEIHSPQSNTYYLTRLTEIEPDLVLVTIVDITERKQMEEVLRENEARLKVLVLQRTRELEQAMGDLYDILESIKDPFFTLDQEWKVTYANSQVLKEYAHLGDVVGKNIWSEFPELEGTVFWENCKRVIERKESLFFESRIPYNGFWLDVSIYPFKDGISVLYRDITERKKIKEALKASEEQFYIAFNMSPVMMAISDATNDKYINVNEYWLIAFGLTRERVIGYTPFELDIFCNPEDLRALDMQIKQNKSLTNYELSFRDVNGETRIGLASSQIVKVNGKDCYLHTMLDITKQKQIEKDISRLDCLNIIGEMAASIGHEIRNPMTSIRGFLQMLNGKKCYEEDRSFFELMIEELDRANGIITEYLAMAKDKRVNLQKQYINNIVKSIYPMIQADSNYKEMDVKLELGKPHLTLIDGKEIRQLVLNMARNGLEAMAPGGILTIGTTIEENEIVLFIKDEGSGLAPEITERLGTPFLTTKEKGTGLGLAVCYSIAARHSAKITYETGSYGTTFYIRFPVPTDQPLPS
ncbi:MAG: PAS domain-containing protein [Syntrophomonas sp.]